jgi:hypothetical protein
MLLEELEKTSSHCRRPKVKVEDVVVLKYTSRHEGVAGSGYTTD